MKTKINFSNPRQPIKTNEKKQSMIESLVEKIGAIIGLVEIGGGMAMPDKVQKKLDPKQRDKVIRVIIFLLIWFVGLGIFETFNLIVQLLKFIF